MKGGYIPILLILFALLAGLIWLFVYLGKRPSMDEPEYTVGSIVGFKQAQKSTGLDAVVNYKVNGNEYETSISSLKYQSNIIGETFKIRYEKGNPEKVAVLKYEPIFLQGENTNTAEGTITRIYQFNWFVDKKEPNFSVEFEFNAHGKNFRKEQILPPNYKELFPDFKKGNIYTIKYLINNPERSIINLNEPRK